MLNETPLDMIRIEDDDYQRVTMYIKRSTLDLIKAASKRDSRPVDHTINLACSQYAQSRIRSGDIPMTRMK